MHYMAEGSVLKDDNYIDNKIICDIFGASCIHKSNSK